MSVSQSEAAFQDALEGLRRGDFSRLDPLFDRKTDSPPQIVEWVDRGRFRGQDQELAEALTCACFNGRTEVAEYLLNRGITASGGADTGLNATHWAVNRGQLAIVGLLIRHKVPPGISVNSMAVLRWVPQSGPRSMNPEPIIS
jgi:hypothetical protein